MTICQIYLPWLEKCRKICFPNEKFKDIKLFVNTFFFTTNFIPYKTLQPLMFAESVIRLVYLRFVCRPTLCNKTE